MKSIKNILHFKSLKQNQLNTLSKIYDNHNFYTVFKCGISKFSREKFMKLKEEQKAKSKIKVDNSEILTKKKSNIKYYTPVEAVEDLLKKVTTDAEKCIILCSANLNVKSHQTIRGLTSSPGGVVRLPRICVFTSPAFEKVARDSGIKMIADAKTYEKILNKEINFDLAIATTEVMNQVKNLGRVLGPLNLMPSPKAGTSVNPDKLAETIKRFQQGVKEFRSSQKDQGVRLSLAKLSFGKNNILKNLDAFIKELSERKPENTKGTKSKEEFIDSVYISANTTKGSYLLDPDSIDVKNEFYFGNKLQ